MSSELSNSQADEDYQASCRRACWLFIVGLFLTVTPTLGQYPANPRQQVQEEDVVRVNTDLVQTDAMVFDKQGHFVSGLKADQFVLRTTNERSLSLRALVPGACVNAGSEGKTSGSCTATASPASATRARTLIFSSTIFIYALQPGEDA
jgi:hypothetical protein